MKPMQSSYLSMSDIQSAFFATRFMFACTWDSIIQQKSISQSNAPRNRSGSRASQAYFNVLSLLFYAVLISKPHLASDFGKP